MKKLLLSLLLIPAIVSCGDGDPMSSLEGKASLSSVSDAPTCSTGGNMVSFGVDDNKDKALQAEEIDHTIIICNGKVGEVGPQGEQGIQGLTGLQGEQGPQGAKGDTGLQGEQGLTGETGPQGEKGETGATGSQGIQGEKGDKGDTGLTGAAGQNGVDGKDGQNGINGTNGTNGIDGVNGTNGVDGRNGVDGTNGVNGSNGHSAAFSAEVIYPGVECAFGGQRLEYGTDLDDDMLLDEEEKTGELNICSVSCGSYVCGGSCGVCGNGLECSLGACSDINECVASIPVCDPNASCSNAVGSYSCVCNEGYEGDGKTCIFIPQCSAVMCGEQCVDTQTDKMNCGQCGVVCGANQACAAGVCLGSGQLRFTSTWSRAGDIDVWVTTPSGKSIGWTNQGANANTDMGKQDRDDTSGTGPENIYWESTPPSGAYHVCVATNYINPNAANPVTVRVEVARPSAESVIEERTYSTSVGFGGACNEANPTYMFSVLVQ
jgi:hypothetical protein